MCAAGEDTGLHKGIIFINHRSAGDFQDWPFSLHTVEKVENVTDKCSSQFSNSSKPKFSWFTINKWQELQIVHV